MYSHEAFKLAIASFAQVLRAPKDLDARALVQLAAAFAGVAIENSMLGAAPPLRIRSPPTTTSPAGLAVGMTPPRHPL